MIFNLRKISKILLLPAFVFGFLSIATASHAATAVYSSTYKAPYCSGSNSSCDSGPSLLNGRDTMSGGIEPNQPNTVNNSCADNSFGAYHSFESNDRLSVGTNDGLTFSGGKAVTVSATVWCKSTVSDYLDLYYTNSIPGAGDAAWTLISTQICTVSGAAQTKTGSYVLPGIGTKQAVRAQFRSGPLSGACTAGFANDRDDLVFDVPSDTTAPVAVSDLAASSPTATSILLNWTAPGDDGITGTATSYDIRYSTAVITDANWASAVQVSGEPAPLVAGSAQSMTVSGLSANTTYYFALKTSDEIPNISALSNVPSGTTLLPPPPTVTTSAASAITPTSATLNGSANPNGFATTGWFRYSATNPGSCSDSFGTRIPSSGGTALGSGLSAVAYSNPISGLTSGTTYYYCAIASNAGGTAFGTVVSFFVPLPAAPTVSLTAAPATVVSGYSTTLTWTSSGADSCSASAVPANAQWTANGGALSGSQTITGMTADTIFTLTCTNLGGSTPSSAAVTVTPPPNVSGHAWAGSGSDDGTNSNPGIGWITMSGIAGDGVPYGVLVSSASPGVLSGYAWVNPNDAVAGTNNIGWIDFGPAGSYPASSFVPAQSARLNRTTGLVTGWARACSVFASGCSGVLKADSERGGWDGWIGFGTGGNYTQPVTVSGCSWSGYAWGGGINIGWIHFGTALYPTTGSGNGCAVVTPQCSDGVDNDGDGLIDDVSVNPVNPDPGCIDANDDDETGPTAPSGLSADAGSTLAACNAIVVSWTDNTADEDRFELERKLSSDPDTAYVEIAEPSAAVGSGTIQNFTDTGAVGGLSRDTSYTYRIRACNGSGCGGYSNTDFANNQNPLPSFTWAPPSPLKNANTTFNAGASTVYGGSSISEYYWTFTDGIPAAFCSSVAGSGCNIPPLTPFASTKFRFPPSPAQKSVVLRVTDSNVPARQCSVTQAVTVRSGSMPPGWEEIPPE